MKEFVGINISLAFNWLFLLFGFCLIFLYSFSHYKRTLPPVSNFLKRILIIFRVLALTIILFLIFEPKIALNYSKSVTPTNFVFIDNSKSMVLKDSIKKQSAILQLINNINNKLIGDNRIFKFSKEVSTSESKDSFRPNFIGTSTNFENIFSFIEKLDPEPSTITIISDGIVNSGKNSYYSAEKLGSPIFTVGVGDTIITSDISIKDISINKYLYADEPTTINLTILNNYLAGERANISFYENGNFKYSKNFVVAEGGINNISFAYTPYQAGKAKLNFKINRLNDEDNINNNHKSLLIDVLKSKLNVLLVSGSPSADFKVIKQSLERDKKLRINQIVQISKKNILNFNIRKSLIDSANIIYLIGFPTKSTPAELSENILNAIDSGNKSYFFCLAKNTDMHRLNKLKNSFPIRLSSTFYGQRSSQVMFENDNTGILKSSGIFNEEMWNSLPPITIFSKNIQIAPGAKLIANAITNNDSVTYPLISAYNLGSNNSLALMGYDFWRWKIHSDENSNNLFDNFVLNSLKWLNNTKRKKLFLLKTDQNIFSTDQKIKLTAELYDQTFSPIDNAKISADIPMSGKNLRLNFSSIGNGIYSSTIDHLPEGMHQINAVAKLDEKIVNKAGTKIIVEKTDIEKYETIMDKDYLELLSRVSNGKYFEIAESNDLISKINNYNSLNSKSLNIKNEYNLLSLKWVLLLVVILFGLEWFIRRQAGML